MWGLLDLLFDLLIFLTILLVLKTAEKKFPRLNEPKAVCVSASTNYTTHI